MVETSHVPIVFIMGLSGSGKSTLGKAVQKDLNYLHIEQDSSEGDGIDIQGLRNEWDAYLYKKEPASLLAKLSDLAIKSNHDGVILTFSSRVMPNIDEMHYTKASGIKNFILYGTDFECLNSYLERERKLKRGYGKKRWLMYNVDTYKKFRQSDYSPFWLLAFKNGKHRPFKDLVKEISELINS